MLLRTAPRLLKAIAVLLLPAVLAGALGRELTPGPGPASHCAGHLVGETRAHDPHHDALMAEATRTASAPAMAAAGHECSHCPPADCASRVPCASMTAAQSLHSTAPGMREPPVLAVAVTDADQRAASAVFQPPTPPPQAAP